QRRERRVERARVLQALRRVDLGRLPVDGVRRRTRRGGSALSIEEAGDRAARSRRMKRFLIPLALFLALASFLAVGLNRDPRELPSPLVGRAAPGFELPRLAPDGARFSPADMKGKVWMLNVWASWCVSCRQEHPV